MDKSMLDHEQSQLLTTLVEAQEKLPRREQQDFRYSPAFTRTKGTIPRSAWIKAINEGGSVGVNP